MFVLFLFLFLSLMMAIYLFLSPRDTIAELKLVFDPSIVRRGMRIRKSKLRFSIGSMVRLTFVSALIIGFMNYIQAPPMEWISGFIFLLLLVGLPYGLYRYVSYDLSMKGPRRQMPERFLHIDEPDDVMPSIVVQGQRPSEDPRQRIEICVEEKGEVL